MSQRLKLNGTSCFILTGCPFCFLPMLRTAKRGNPVGFHSFGLCHYSLLFFVCFADFKFVPLFGSCASGRIRPPPRAGASIAQADPMPNNGTWDRIFQNILSFACLFQQVVL